MDSATRYQGPLQITAAKSKFGITTLADNPFNREGPRSFVEYRDLGLSTATDGRIGAKHIRAIRPFDKETGWHWHDMDGHFVYVLKGRVRFQFDGMADPVTVDAGSCISQPGGVAHNVIGQSDDLEIIEINLPAAYATVELPPKA